MNWAHLILFGLKLGFLIQFAILLSGNKFDKKIYLITEIVFKICLSLYIEYFLLFGGIKGIPFEDKLVIGFGSGLLLYDAVYNDMSNLLELYNLKPFSLY
jgi:hypothetical protein